MHYYLRLNVRLLPAPSASQPKSELEPYELTIWLDYSHAVVEEGPLADYLAKLKGVDHVSVTDVLHKAPGTTIINIRQARRPQRKWEDLIREILLLIAVVCCEKGEGLEELEKAPYQEP